MMIRMKHIFQKVPGGVFYFRRRVPSCLVDKVGKKVIVASLKTTNAGKAQLNATRFRKELEGDWRKLLVSEATSISEAQKLLDSYGVDQYDSDDGTIGRGLFLDHLMDKQPESLIEQYQGSYNSLTAIGANLTPTDRKALQVMSGTISLSDAVDYYIENSGKKGNRKFVNSMRRSQAFFVEELGDIPINGYRRKDIGARLLRGVEVDGLKTATVSRRLSDIRSAVNRVILDFEYEFKNPFEKQTIPNLREDEQSRTSLTPILQHDGLIELFSKGEYGDTLNGLRMLFDTGMRVSEVVGLRAEDVLIDHKKPHIRLQRNPFRSLKTKQSQRLIPLIGYALEGARRQLDVSNEWLFPRYIDHGRQQVKNDNASAAMNKRLKPLGFTCHSLRHNLKDRLRRANVPMDNIRELQGWSRADQASRYGEMSLLGLLAADMAKINV